MDKFELTIRNGTVATEAETARRDIGIAGGKIVAMAERLPAGTRDIDAAGRYVLPGGIDSHCHIEGISESIRPRSLQSELAHRSPALEPAAKFRAMHIMFSFRDSEYCIRCCCASTG